MCPLGLVSGINHRVGPSTGGRLSGVGLDGWVLWGTRRFMSSKGGVRSSGVRPMKPF